MVRTKYDHDIKLVVVGDGGVGKTSLLVSYTHNYFPGDYIPTVFEHYTANVIWDTDKIVRLSLWDTAGQEDYDKLRPMSYPNTNVFMACYSTVDPETLANVSKKWIPEVRQYAPGAPIVLVGTKSDMRDHRSVVLKLQQEKKSLPLSKEDGISVKKDLKLDGFVECSALTKRGLKDAFDECIRAVVYPCQDRYKANKKMKKRKKKMMESSTENKKKKKLWKKKCVLM